MIVFPPEYIKTRYPGYVWNTKDQLLYTIKCGALKPLTLHKPWRDPRSGRFFPERYVISVNGQRKYLMTETLRNLKPIDTIETMWKHEYEKENCI